MHRLLTAAETADLLRISRDRLYQLLQSRALVGIKVGGAWRIRPEDLEEFLRQNELPVQVTTSLSHEAN